MRSLSMQQISAAVSVSLFANSLFLSTLIFEPSTLITDVFPRSQQNKKVEAAGFEPATSGVRFQRSPSELRPHFFWRLQF